MDIPRGPARARGATLSSPDVASTLRAWLANEYGGKVVDAEAPRAIGAGFSTLIDYVRFAGERLPPEWQRPLVARTHRTVSEAAVARREAAIQEWCCTHQYPAPRVIALFGPGELLDLPVQVMQRGPDLTLLDAVKRAPWRAPALVDRLASLQIQLHALPVSNWPDGEREGLAERRLRLVRRWLATHEDADLSAALSRVEPLLPDLEAAPAVACHGDFHPLNVLVDADTSMVIDWTDAALGDRHGDVVAHEPAVPLRCRPRDVEPGGKGRDGRHAGVALEAFPPRVHALGAARRRSPQEMGSSAPPSRVGPGRRGPRGGRRARTAGPYRAPVVDQEAVRGRVGMSGTTIQC